MSFSFMRHFVAEGGKEALASATTAIASAAPETASKAQIGMMDEELTAFGLKISGIKRRVEAARTLFTQNDRQFHQKLDAAHMLQNQITEANATALAAETPPDQKTAAAAKVTSLTASLGRLLDDVEKMKPEHDTLEHDLEETEGLLNDANTAYKTKAASLVTANADLARGRAEVDRARMAEERAHQRAEDAAIIAGVTKSGTGTGVNVALNAFTKIADASRDRAAADELKAKELRSHVEPATTDDPNIAAALAAAAGSTPTSSLTDRLAALGR